MPEAKLLAFQTDLPAEVFLWRTVSLGVIHEISEMTRPERFLADRGSLSALLSYVASSFCPAECLRQTRDDAVLISEFISKNYNRSISVAELAKQLCLSTKQTERLVKKYTGHSFKEAVMRERLRVAAFLEANSDMSRTAIAAYIGYANYSGYCKAKKRLSEHL